MKRSMLTIYYVSNTKIYSRLLMGFVNSEHYVGFYFVLISIDYFALIMFIVYDDARVIFTLSKNIYCAI